MSDALIAAGSGGELKLSGVLDYSTGPALREEGRQIVKSAAASKLLLDCSGVEHSSSVGLSLVLALMRDAREAGKTLSVCNMPDDMQGIAKVSGLLEILAPGH
ncbi:STAS domain-containing protein [Pseudomonas sp. LRF_L74]|uniref:STAS domain-containing protein n=1 Tax=Pseudomonas sp. LRF_L74 TaxID=3369422 RepID=UPI003F5F92D2